jgi:DNA-directed RNA polymerase subunit RPC12/RpoP
MKCARCGAKVLLGSAQCTKCGASMLDGSLPQEAAPSRDKKITTSEPPYSPPKPLQATRYEPI